MKVRVTLDQEYNLLDFFSQDELDDFANKGVPMDFADFKSFLMEFFYEDSDELAQAVKFEEVKE